MDGACEFPTIVQLSNFESRCNAYNVSVASACLLAVSFGIGIFFNVQDLHSSKQSPRTRA